MQKLKNWKEFVNRVLISSGQFESSTSELKNDTEIETFKSTDKSSQTEIRVGYLKKNLLIYLQVFNPKIPGYNEYSKSEYFYSTDFNENDDRKDVGLIYNEINLNGISEMLSEGLIGTETQIKDNGKILKSILNLEREENFPIRYDFTNRSFWEKLLSKNIEIDSKYQKTEIDLRKIFSGIKTCYNKV
jgi:hypothetical protein